jgi:hypothetical protein
VASFQELNFDKRQSDEEGLDWQLSMPCLLLRGNMNYLLFECTFARFIWQMVVCAFGFVRPPESAADMLGVWIGSFQHH